jgi:hypothetical protein
MPVATKTGLIEVMIRSLGKQFLMLAVLGCCLPAFSRAEPLIYEYVERNDKVSSLEDIHFFIRMPQSLKKDEQVRGVLVDLIYLRDPVALKKWLVGNNGALVQFAEKHKLAVLTSTTATIYSIADSFNQTDRKRFTLDDNMERSARAWNRALNVICKTYNLPDRDFLMYGISRGAQWAHRLALREPQRFLAVHAHVNSSYEEPVAQANTLLWLITTGDREYGYPAARAFYEKCRTMGYPILFKSQGNLGHDSSPEIERLGICFFEYALQLKEERDRLVAEKQQDEFAPHEIPKKGFPPQVIKNFFDPPYVGDLLNEDVYPAASASRIPEKLRVAIPTLEIAKAWGYVQTD